MSSISVLFLEPTLNVGGAERILFEIVTRLDRDRFAPVVCCLKEPGPIGDALLDTKVPLHHGIISSRYSLAPFPALFRLMRRERIQIIHTINQPLNTTWGAMTGKLAGVPVQVTSVHSMRGLPRQTIRRAVNRAVNPFVDAVIALSNAHRDYLVGEDGMDPRKVRVIHNGIDVRRFNRPTNLRRTDVGLPETGRIVGVVAGLRPEKAHDVFLRAAAQVREQVTDAHFVLIGDGAERNRLIQLTETLALSSHVHFLGRRDDVADLLPLLDLSVLPSRSEAFPLAILESMAAGLPVVATDVGSIRDIVAPGENGLIVPAGDERELARAIESLLTNPDLARDMGQAGKGRVTAYDVRRMVHDVEVLFEDLLRQKSSTAPLTRSQAY